MESCHKLGICRPYKFRFYNVDYSRNSRLVHRESGIRFDDDKRADGNELVGSKIRGPSARSGVGGLQARGTLGFRGGEEPHIEQLGCCDGSAEGLSPHSGRTRTRGPYCQLHVIPVALHVGGRCSEMSSHDHEPQAALDTELPGLLLDAASEEYVRNCVCTPSAPHVGFVL